jgi:Zn-dependent M28 family amino/carboxypeptidase
MRWVGVAALVLFGCQPSIEDDIREPPDSDSGLEETDEPTPFVLVDRIDVARMIGHLEALSAIARDNENTRVNLSPGYASSVDYVISVLERAGLSPAIDTFPIQRYQEGRVDVEIVAPTEAARSIRTLALRFGGAGEVEAPVVAVDVQIPPGRNPNSSTSGCEPSDFLGFPKGAVALVQRGTCTFSQKVDNAIAAGAAAILIFNEGQTGRTDVVEGVLAEGGLAAIPALGIGYDDGAELAALAGARVRVTAEISLTEDEDQNVLVTIPGQDGSRVLMVGAHLDSVQAGPGINDNGSGTALLLEFAEQAAQGGWRPQTDVRLAWWGAEEIGLVGSGNYFLDDAGEADQTNLQGMEAYLNFDMLASPNGGRFVYDGDGSSTEEDIANPGSIFIESLFEAHFASVDQATRPVALVTRSDSYWAVLLGIPWGGLFSGAEAVKSSEEAQLFGGDPNEAYDACYHRSCDTIEGIDPVLYADLGRAAAVVVQQLADSPTPVPTNARFAPGDEEWSIREDLPRPYGCHGEPPATR